MAIQKGEIYLYADRTVKVTEETKQELEKIKIHRREPFNEVIQRLLNFYKKKQEKKE